MFRRNKTLGKILFNETGMSRYLFNNLLEGIQIQRIQFIFYSRPINVKDHGVLLKDFKKFLNSKFFFLDFFYFSIIKYYIHFYGF